jgi:hypothetical protein
MELGVWSEGYCIHTSVILKKLNLLQARFLGFSSAQFWPPKLGILHKLVVILVQWQIVLLPPAGQNSPLKLNEAARFVIVPDGTGTLCASVWSKIAWSRGTLYSLDHFSPQEVCLFSRSN